MNNYRLERILKILEHQGSKKENPILLQNQTLPHLYARSGYLQ